MSELKAIGLAVAVCLVASPIMAGERPAGERFRDCDQCPEMVVIPAGSFAMGSPPSEEGRGWDEWPIRQVAIAQPFAVGVYEVTRDEYAHFISESGHSANEACHIHDQALWPKTAGRNWREPGIPQSGRHPVVCINWNDARAYVDWLAARTGKAYRLLSEAEWEYAARAGTTTPFHAGATISTDQANYNGRYTYGSGSKGEFRENTVPVGSYPANAFGLHDTMGNVWEYVQDCWNPNYVGAPADGSAWEAGNCERRVIRGGSSHFPPHMQRSAYRMRNGSDEGYNDCGFRVALTFDP